MKQRWKADLVLSLVIIVFCVGNFIYANNMSAGLGMDYPLAQPNLYLKLWLSLLILLSVLLLIRALREKSREACEPIWNRMRLLTVLCMALYLFLMEYFGFFLCTLAFMLVMIVSYSLYMKGRLPVQKKAFALQIVIWIVVAFCFTVAVQYIFAEILDVVLPEGTFF